MGPDRNLRWPPTKLISWHEIYQNLEFLETQLLDFFIVQVVFQKLGHKLNGQLGYCQGFSRKMYSNGSSVYRLYIWLFRLELLERKQAKSRNICSTTRIISNLTIQLLIRRVSEGSSHFFETKSMVLVSWWIISRCVKL